MKKTIWFLILVLVSCNSKDVFQQEFPLPIADYYFSANGNQTVFRIELKQPISDAIEIQNLYFRNQKASVKMISEACAFKSFAIDFRDCSNKVLAERPKLCVEDGLPKSDCITVTISSITS